VEHLRLPDAGVPGLPGHLLRALRAAHPGGGRPAGESAAEAADLHLRVAAAEDGGGEGPAPEDGERGLLRDGSGAGGPLQGGAGRVPAQGLRHHRQGGLAAARRSSPPVRLRQVCATRAAQAAPARCSRPAPSSSASESWSTSW
jgi:hypothetical protein